jgi:hypothetical protein
MKCYILLALLVSIAAAAPLSGSVSSSANFNGASFGGNSNVDVDTKIKGFGAFLYLVAPQSWITAWEGISDEGKKCFMNAASDPASADIYNGDDENKIKEDLKAKCASTYDKLEAFCNATKSTMENLPKSFLDISKTWGQQMQDLGNKYKNAGSAGAVQSASAAKDMISQFSKPTGDYMAALAALSQEDRQKISDAFPKLTAFFSGDHAVEFLNEITELYKTMGNGNFNADSLKDPAKKLVTTWGTIWQQYKENNKDGLTKASGLLGKDLTKAGDEFAAELTAKANGASNGMSGFPSNGAIPAASPMGAQPFGAPSMNAGGSMNVDGIKKRAEEAKAKSAS